MRLSIHRCTRVAGNPELEHIIGRGFVPVPNRARSAMDLYDMLASKQMGQADREVPGNGGGVGMIGNLSSWFDMEVDGAIERRS